jgi:hypothetical protein
VLYPTWLSAMATMRGEGSNRQGWSRSAPRRSPVPEHPVQGHHQNDHDRAGAEDESKARSDLPGRRDGSALAVLIRFAGSRNVFGASGISVARLIAG